MISKTLLTNIVICYENEDEVASYAKEIASQSIGNCVKLIVVVNKENKGIDYLDNALKMVGVNYQIVNPANNIGYFNGLVYGYREGTKNSLWYALSNTDITIPSSTFFEEFLGKEYLNNSHVWAVGPSVFAPLARSFSNPYMLNRPSKKTYEIKNLLMRFPRVYETVFRLKRRVKSKLRHARLEATEVYAMHGSFMFLHHDFLEILMSCNSWELLYDEEQYIAEIRMKYHKIAFFDPTLLVHHWEGTSTGKEQIFNRYKMMIKSNKRIIKEFY